jgi:hypothetical protein
MDVAIALGQGAGLAVACGLLAGIPLAVAALAALIFGFDTFGEPGAARAIDDTAVVVALCAIGVIDALLEVRLSGRLQIAVRAIGGAAVFGLLFWHEVPFLGLVLGLAIAALAATVGRDLLASAVKAGDAVSATLIAIAATIVVAILSLIPFVGYVVLAVGAWFALRQRRRGEERYAGLRVLR